MELYKINTKLPVMGYCESGIGGRAENQDSYGFQDTPWGLLVVVCDGMGGGPAGKTASTIAVNEIIAGVMEADRGNTAGQVLTEAIQRANHAILNKVAANPNLQGMGTTCAAVLLSGDSALVAHVGDSRVYQLRHHRKVFRTFDHSVVFDLVKQKVITEEQARLSEQSNVITRALGMKGELEIDLEERPYKKGDRFMLCSDGIHGSLAEPELIAMATQNGPLDQIVDRLAKHVDAQGHAQGGGHDNLTLVIMELQQTSKLKEPLQNKTTLVLGIIVAFLAVLALALNGCQNKDIDIDTFSIAEEHVRPGIDTVHIEGTYDFFNDAREMKLNIGCDSTLSEAAHHPVALMGKDYAVTVRNLQPDTRYYYNYTVNLGLSDHLITSTKHFNTLPAPVVQQFTVSAVAEPEEGGTASGGGTFAEGQTCTLKAVPNDGYDFVNWTENDSLVSTDTLIILIVTHDRSLTAHFEPQAPPAPEEYSISVSAAPNEGGTVSGGGNYEAGQSCTVRATANTGYTFVNWTENGEQVSNNANYTFTVNGNRTLVANFTTSSYIISVTVDPEESGTIRGIGGYDYGQSCSLRASANPGYTFVKWTENGNEVSTSATYTFNVTASRTLVAHFEAQTYTIAVSAQPPVAGIALGGGSFAYGQSCTVRATANSGYTFSKWTENGNQVSTSANYTFTINGNRTLVAHFTANPQNYTITVSADPTHGGSVSGGGSYQLGQNCTVSATANSGYTFSNWTENGNVVSSNPSYSFIVTGNRTLVAHFIANPQSYTITVTANPTNGGTVNGGGTYQQGQSCTVTAEANRLSSFYVDFESGMPANWTTIDANNDGYDWVLGSNVGGIYADPGVSFAGLGHNESNDFICSGSYSNVTQQGIVPDNYLVSPQVTLAAGSTFSFWACGQDAGYPGEHFGVAVSTSGNTNPSDFTMLQEWTMTSKSGRKVGGGNRGSRTQGTWHQYSVDLSSYAGQQVYIAIRHFNCYDMFCLDVDDVELTGNTGFSFVNWTENGNVVSTNASYTFTVNSNRNLVANFTQQAPQSYHINVSANPTNGGSVSGGGTYQQGQTCTVRASANSGYTFTNWTESGNVVSTNTNYTFTVNGNRSLVANFEQQGSQNGTWLYYDDGTYATCIGTNEATSTFYWASMFPAELLVDYVGTCLTKVAVFQFSSSSTNPVMVTIYLGGTTAPGTAYSTTTFTPSVDGDFEEVNVDPVAIDGTQNLWIVCSQMGAHPANACADSGEPNNRWISLDGTAWQDLASAGLPGYGWLLRGFVTDGTKNLILPLNDCIKGKKK